jgi:hypothetical protein
MNFEQKYGATTLNITKLSTKTLSVIVSVVNACYTEDHLTQVGNCNNFFYLGIQILNVSSNFPEIREGPKTYYRGAKNT